MVEIHGIKTSMVTNGHFHNINSLITLMDLDTVDSPVLRTPNGHCIKRSNTLEEANSIIASLVDAVFVSQAFASKTNSRPTMLEKRAKSVAQLALSSNNTFWCSFAPDE